MKPYKFCSLCEQLKIREAFVWHELDLEGKHCRDCAERDFYAVRTNLDAALDAGAEHFCKRCSKPAAPYKNNPAKFRLYCGDDCMGANMREAALAQLAYDILRAIPDDETEAFAVNLLAQRRALLSRLEAVA